MSDTVRPAVQADEAPLMAMAPLLHGESGLFEMDEDYVRDMLLLGLRQQGGIVGVVGDPGDPKAAVLLMMTRMWYSKQYYLNELSSYVKPDCRISDYADQLIEFSKQCAVKLGIPLVAGVLSTERLQAKVRLYRRKLGYPAGAFFVYNADWDTSKDDEFWKEPFPARRGGRKARNHRTLANGETAAATIGLAQ